MFCMGCGAEVPARAVVCPVCGRGTGGRGDARAASAQAGALDKANMIDGAGERGAPRELSAAPTLALAAAPTAPAGPSIGSGDLDQPGFPRDALGRSLIFTVLAMAADLLAPWVNVDGNRIAPSSLGLLPALGAVWLALAVLPLLRPSLRATPLYAAAPLMVGATSLGLAAAVWIRVTLFGAQPTAQSGGDSAFQVLGASSSAYQSLSTSSSADMGLYLFLAGSVVLIIAGYQMFLAAARAEAHAGLRAEGLAEAPERGASAGSAVPPARPAASDGRATTPAARGAATAVAPDPRPLPSPPLTPVPAVPDAPPLPAPQRGVALPGSAAWNQTPHTPDFQRPSPLHGWRHRG